VAKEPKLDITVKVPPSMFNALDAMARDSKGEFTRSDIIRQALAAFITSKQPLPQD
jgi:metal-responsive CopG/Arc/MetJ family transcriptional regulator